MDFTILHILSWLYSFTHEFYISKFFSQFLSHLLRTLIQAWGLSVLWRCYGYLTEKKVARQIRDQLTSTATAFHYPENLLGYSLMSQPPPYAVRYFFWANKIFWARWSSGLCPHGISFQPTQNVWRGKKSKISVGLQRPKASNWFLCDPSPQYIWVMLLISLINYSSPTHNWFFQM